MNIYFESSNKQELVPVSKDAALLQVLTDKRYILNPNFDSRGVLTVPFSDI